MKDKYSMYLAAKIKIKRIKNIRKSTYSNKYIKYSMYLAAKIDSTINYGEYLSENLDKSISYSEYFSGEVIH